MIRATRLDAHLLSQHPQLRPTDICFYLHEYTAGEGYVFSKTNSLISNLKKPMEKRGLQEFRHKADAIAKCSSDLAEGLGAAWFTGNITWVPMPPSKAKGDPEHDDRLLQILRSVGTVRPAVDVRELLAQKSSVGSASSGQGSRDPTTIANNLEVPPGELAVTPQPWVCVLDDVLTTGSHFTAARTVLQAAWPSVNVCGCFIARCVYA